ncbi:Hypothetical protein FKW44_023668, partial [Caligus rogercresseyi]
MCYAISDKEINAASDPIHLVSRGIETGKIQHRKNWLKKKEPGKKWPNIEKKNDDAWKKGPKNM